MKKRDFDTARWLADHSLYYIQDCSIDGYQVIAEQVQKVGNTAGWSYYGPANDLIRSSFDIIESFGLDGLKEAADAICSVAEKNQRAASRVGTRLWKILKKIDKSKELVSDYILIESIINQKEAQEIGPLIREEYLDLYKEKVQKFY